jgi:thiamine-phosphate pyrophosphorylase
MRLYALCDQDMLDKQGVSIERFVEISREHSAEIIQYRNKNADIAFIKKVLIQIRKLFDGFVIVNDKYELIDFCDGVHVGQEDLLKIDTNKSNAVKVLRSLIGKDKILGISTHNKSEIVESNDMDLNYIGLGAYRETSTKQGITNILGESADKLASFSKHPVALIGGVKLDDKFKYITYHVIGSGLIKK